MYGNLIDFYRVSNEDTMQSKRYFDREKAEAAYAACAHGALLQETDVLIEGHPETVVIAYK